MATTADAELVLKLYDLRREEVLRKARLFVTFEFAPKTEAEFMAIAGGGSTEQHAYWRQATTYWEMAASFVLRGAVDSDLYFDSNGEGLFIFAKYRAFHAEYQKATGMVFMRNTATLVERFPAARDRYDRIVAMQEARAAKG